MNLALFSFWGYLSVLLWLAVPALWLLHAVRRPRRWFCHYAVVVAVVALGVAKLNSVTYVNRIQIDYSEQIAAEQARQEAARKAAEASRAGDVAQVRFAEDDASDYLDEAGMDEADLKYLGSFDEAETPEWKKQKKSRSQTPASDDSLESMLDPTAEAEKGVDTEVIEDDAEKEPIMMPEKQYMLANRLDGLNLKWIRLLILAGVGVVVLDYLKRSNCYEDAYLPLPLPSRWLNGMAPLPVVRALPDPPRRTMPEELAWLVQKGDTFLYLTDDSRSGAAIPQQLPRLPLDLLPVDVLHVSPDDALIDSDFVFETLWYGRSSFVVDSAARATPLVARLLELLELRKISRAKVRQTVHVVWDLPTPLSPETVAAFERLGRATGFVLVV
jgi:hypothetical protein